jgi:hypothetical protein
MNMFRHEQIWTAFEAIAERRGMSLSALSKSAGLDPTSFNPSKRHGPDGRERWPSTETLSRVLAIASMTLRDLADLLDAQAARAEISPEEPKPSRRRHKRFPSILEGRIKLGADAPQISCTIRDISMSGARIWVPESLDLPGEFELEIPTLEQTLQVRLVWSKAKTHGVMFLDELRQQDRLVWAGKTDDGAMLPEEPDQSPGNDASSFLNLLQTPDDTTYFEDSSKRHPLLTGEAPKRSL